MSVDKVQFKQWLSTQPETVKDLSRKEQKLLFEAKQVQDKLKGLEVDHSEEQPAISPEEKAAKTEAQTKELKRITEMKAYANQHRNQADGVGKNLTLTAQEGLSPDKGTKYGNGTNFKNELTHAYMENDEVPTEKALVEQYGEATGKAVAKVIKDLEYRKTHFATHDAYLDRASWKKDKREQLDDDAKRRDFKNNNTLVDNKKVKSYIKDNFTHKDGQVDTQKLKDFVLQYVGTDFEVNYGIHKKHKGGFGQDEYRMLMDETGLNRRQVRLLIESAGGFTEKSDKALKVLKGAALGGAVGGALGTALGSAVNVSATAEATVTNKITGEVLDHAYDKAVGHLIGAGASLGSIVGAVVGMGATAILYNYDGKRDIMNGYAVEQVVANPELMTKGLKDPSDLDKAPMHMIGVLKAAKVPEEEIVHAFKLAKGNATGNNVNINEAITAIRMLEAKYKTEPPASPEDAAHKPELKEKIVMESTPEIDVKKTEDTTIDKKQIPTFGYERKPGEYWYGIAQNMYQTQDGKPIDAKTANAIARKMKDAYNIDKKSADMPKIVNLDYEVEIDGKKYKLIDVSDPSKIKRTVSTEASKGRIIDNQREPETIEVKNTTYGYQVTVDGEIKKQQVGFKTQKERDEAAQFAADSLKQAHPPIIIKTMVKPEEE